MKRFNKIFAVCLTLSVLGGYLLPSPWTCGGFTEPVTVEVQAEGEPTTIDSGIGVLITMLLANGIRFVGNFNDSVKPGIEKLWNDFTTATGNQITLATLGAQSVVQLGYLRTSSAVNNAVNAFQQWYVDTFSVGNNSSVEIPVASGGLNYLVPPAEMTEIGLTGGYYYYWQIRGSDVRTIVLGDSLTNITMYVFSTIQTNGINYKAGNTGNSIQAQNRLTVDGVRYYYGIMNRNNSDLQRRFMNAWWDLAQPIVNGSIDVNTAWNYCYGSNAGIGDISMQGETLKLIDGYDISSDQAKLIDIAGLESLVGTLGLTLENVNDLIDSIPLIMDYPWAETFPDDPTYADTPVDAIPWVDAPTAVVPAEVPEYVPETPADEGSYKILGLERVFPFSIPFDFIAVVNLLNAEPVCPEFTFRVYNPISGQNIDATMSFERFEAVAQVIRIAETIGFIVFLILITRSLIRS